MIININTPNRFQPSDNPIMFSWTSNRGNIHYYMVRVYVSPNNIDAPTLLLTTLQVYPFPTGDYKTTELNLSAILKDYVQTQFKYNSFVLTNGYQRHPENLRGYRLEITEYYVLNGVVTIGDSIDSGTKYIFKSYLDQVTFASYVEKALYLDYNEIVNPTGAPKTKFMTSIRDYKPVYKGFKEFIYFLSDTPMTYLFLEVTARFNDNSTITFNVYDSIDEGAASRMQVTRLDVSPEHLFTPLQLESLISYSVVLKNKIFGPVTTIRELTNRLYFKLKEFNCNQYPLQYWFLNDYGCFEPIVLVNAKENILYNRQTMLVNNLRRNRYGEITEWNDFQDVNEAKIFNQEERDILVEARTRQELVSVEQTDTYREWYKTLHKTKRIYFQLTDEIFIPCRSLSTSFDNNKIRYTLKDMNSKYRLITLEFDRNFEVDFIDLSQDYNPPTPEPLIITSYIGNFI